MAEGPAEEISLRQWLDRPGRSVDRYECLHIFHQIADIVSNAHCEGIAVGNVRPSCFVISALNRVAFIESDSTSASGSASGSASSDGGGGPPFRFQMKQFLLLEFEWYTSSDDGCGCLLASDVYQLGVLLFELFCTFGSVDEKLMSMSNLRHRVLPPQLLLKWPKEASFCLWLLHPQPDSRPMISDVLRSDFLNEPKCNLEEREAAIKLKEEIEDQELLLKFLRLTEKKKQEAANKLHDTVCFLSTDIEEVLSQQSVLLKKGYSCADLVNDEQATIKKLNHNPDYPLTELDSSCAGSRKRIKSDNLSYNSDVHNDINLNEDIHDEIISEVNMPNKCEDVKDNVLLKNSRLMKNFSKFEAAYLLTRCRARKSAGKLIDQQYPVSSTGKGSIARTGVSSVDCITSNEGCKGRKVEWINPLLEGLCKYLSFSKLSVRADLRQGDLLNTSNLVCSVGFDRDKQFFATAGANRKIKIFECDMILDEDRDIHYPVVEMKSRSKISSISWNSYIKSQIASSDFEGIVQVWDVTRNQVLAEMREHERRVWSVEFSPADPMKLASGGDDGAVKLWNINQAGSIGTIKTKANVCSVQFSPDSACSVAIGSADHKVYCYDLRNLRVPCYTLVGHTRTVSYVKYLDSSTIVSASTDSSLKLWDLSTNTSRVLDNSFMTYTGHTNVKNFVGLSIYDGYIATGSETNEVFVYHKAFPMPVLSYKFDTLDPISGQEVGDAANFISSVCWRGGKSPTLLAADSSGNIKLLEMV